LNLFWYSDFLVPFSQPLAKNTKSHKIIGFVARSHSGTRSQKLIKHLQYTQARAFAPALIEAAAGLAL
jgi:hypothetical protein